MNLIDDAWIPVVRQDGSKENIAPWQIAEENNPVIEISVPRPDFQGALYQFLIGLLQTTFAPRDEDEWFDLLETPPEPNTLKSIFSKINPAFKLYDPKGTAFMQDFDANVGKDKSVVSILSLLIGAPGEQTIKLNTDHFVKQNPQERLCHSCAATALFTLQINAPSGGSGHRTGIRGGGPLTTLILPKKQGENLWRKLWLNVLDLEVFPNECNQIDAKTLPWLGETKISKNKNSETHLVDNSPYHHYWGMPRRIRLSSPVEVEEICSVCLKQDKKFFTDYHTLNYGFNYSDSWIHPLTPYNHDKNKEKPPLPVKGKKGGLGYKDWSGLVLVSDKKITAAKVVAVNSKRTKEEKIKTKLWCFGYDMDNMKARCWYDHTMPLYFFDGKQEEKIKTWSEELVSCALVSASILRKSLKEAWFKRPKDAKGDFSFVAAEFWQSTEKTFYAMLEKFVKRLKDPEQRQPTREMYKEWHSLLHKEIFEIFDRFTLDASPEDLNLKQTIRARNGLKKYFHGSKEIKELKIKFTQEDDNAK